MGGGRICPGQIRWGGALKLLPVDPSVCGRVGQALEMLDMATAGPEVVKR